MWYQSQFFSVCIWTHVGEQSGRLSRCPRRLHSHCSLDNHFSIFLQFVFPSAPHFFGRTIRQVILTSGTRKCGCKGGVVSASCCLQPPRNGLSGQVPILELETFSGTILETPRACTRCSCASTRCGCVWITFDSRSRQLEPLRQFGFEVVGRPLRRRGWSLIRCSRPRLQAGQASGQRPRRVA